MNELYWLAMLIINFIAIMVAFRLWGKVGLFIWIPISVIVANIQVLKIVNLFGLEATLGNIVYATSFLATDILSEFYGKKEATKGVAIGFFALVVMSLMMNVALLFEPAATDFINPSLKAIFSLMPRVAFASLVAYLVSQFHDVISYQFYKKIRPGVKYLWLRNNFSTLVSQLLDTIIFTLIAFLGVYERGVLIQIVISTYLLKAVVALLDTPFIYLAHYWHKNKVISD
ncbi:MAG: queuosine precursor transporter [Sphaerochaetaceae bacterium]